MLFNDEFYMREALRVAAFARGRTSPNPLVGAVIVKSGRIVGLGWHRQAGTPHAEIHALKMAGALAEGATIYVTLEPCAHYGRTGPCAEALVKAKIARCVIACLDPNPLVAGKGAAILAAAGIKVTVGLLENEARTLNEIFFKWITTKRPFTIWKTAMSLDGKIATATGESQWITGAESRAYGHRLRDECDAVMVGIGTVLADDPLLTTRLEFLPEKTVRITAEEKEDKNISAPGKNPRRIIVDSSARTPLGSRLIKKIAATTAPTIIAVSPSAPQDKITALRDAGAEIIIVPTKNENERVDLTSLMDILGNEPYNITSLLIEGGSTLAISLLKNHLIDKVHAFIAPMLIGGKDALSALGGDGFSHLADASVLENPTIEKIGNDFHITGYTKKN